MPERGKNLKRIMIRLLGAENTYIITLNDIITIEEAIKNTLKGEILNCGLDKRKQDDFLQSHGKLALKQCVVRYLRFGFDAGILHITPFLCEYEHNSLSDGLKNIVWANKKEGKSCDDRYHLILMYNR